MSTIADNNVATIVHVDHVVHGSAEDDVVAGACDDVVIVAHGSVEAFHGQPLASSIEGRSAVVTEHKVAAFADRDRIPSGSAKHHVFPNAGGDHVMTTVAGIDRRQ